jgi:ferric hydroxamate transport system ATP-binding protein
VEWQKQDNTTPLLSLEQSQMPHSAAARLPEPTAPNVLALHDVSYSVDGKVLLHPTTLDFKAGQSIALVGHNGSGKSTLLKLLGRQISPSGGAIHFDRLALQNWGARSFARRVAYLPQQVPAASGVLVRELVALGRYPWHGALGSFSATDHSKVEEALALTGVEAFAERLVDTLSGGERQRVWLAMLLAQDADCLLLDEPIAALDIGQQIEMLALIRDLSRERDVTVITVLHDINMASRFCDQIVALKAGRLSAVGTPEDIMTPETLLRIFDVPMDVVRQAGSGRLVALAK